VVSRGGRAPCDRRGRGRHLGGVPIHDHPDPDARSASRPAVGAATGGCHRRTSVSVTARPGSSPRCRHRDLGGLRRPRLPHRHRDRRQDDAEVRQLRPERAGSLPRRARGRERLPTTTRPATPRRSAAVTGESAQPRELVSLIGSRPRHDRNESAMTTMQWDPTQYLTYGDHRLRPFVELMNRVLRREAGEHRRSRLWAGERDGAAHRTLARGFGGRRRQLRGDDRRRKAARDPRQAALRPRRRLLGLVGEPDRRVDLKRHPAVGAGAPPGVSRYIEMLAPDGWFAFQVPGHAAIPSHSLIYDLAGSARWVDQLGPYIRQNEIESTDQYIETLTSLGCDVDAWETTYFQLLEGDDAVLEWVKGSSLRPFISALERDRRCGVRRTGEGGSGDGLSEGPRRHDLSLPSGLRRRPSNRLARARKRFPDFGWVYLASTGRHLWSWPWRSAPDSTTSSRSEPSSWRGSSRSSRPRWRQRSLARGAS
jgi:trans-aconitate 2-methyltransferase